MLRFLLIISLLSITFSALPQDNNTNIYLYDDIIYEKLYLHIDRMMYSPGEDVWFKIYLVSGIDHRLISGNKNVYIQLIDSHGNVVDNRLILTVNGTAKGDFKLQNDLQDGYYTIRAYTKYQENFGEENYFHKKIWISGIGSAVARPESDQLSQIEFGLYPESGVLIKNVANTIAFKANDFNGHGIDVSGYIMSDQGDTITHFKSEFLGMGSFKFMPEEGRSYFAKLTDYPGYSYTFNNIISDGATLQFLDNGRSLMFAIVRNLKNNATKQY
ncbi:MAG TPA: MG2 domain-containing protein, partial [Bacteroidales bacterium]|nr:MG2 domain-containing protein [Bacteroidales bacterium]